MNPLTDCPMCGNPAKRLVGRWYQYDNGEQELTFVCTACADRHAEATKRRRTNA
jgi:hypothetical protein